MASLYINHQKIASLIYSLQEIVDKCVEQNEDQYQSYELRTSIYDEYVKSTKKIWNKTHEGWEEGNQEFETESCENEGYIQRQKNNKNHHANTNRNKKSGRPVQNLSLESEMKLVEWIISQNRVQFTKKQVEKKYCEHGKRKTLPISRIKTILKNYKLYHIQIQDRNKQIIQFNQEEELSDLEDIKIEVKEQVKEEDIVQIQEVKSFCEQATPWTHFVNGQNCLGKDNDEKSIFYSESQQSENQIDRNIGLIE